MATFTGWGTSWGTAWDRAAASSSAASWGNSWGSSWGSSWSAEPSPFPNTPLTNVQMQQLFRWVNELALIHGLVAGSDLVVSPTARSAGAVSQIINEAAGVVTVVRP